MANVTDQGGGSTPGPIAALQTALSNGLNPFAATVEAIRRAFGYDLGSVPGSSPPISFGSGASIVGRLGPNAPGFNQPGAPPPVPPPPVPPPPPPAPAAEPLTGFTF